MSYGSTESVGWTGAAPPTLGFTAHRRRRWHDAEALIGAPRAEWPAALRRLRQIGLALIGMQFLAFCIWSAILVHRVALTHDFITYEQAFFLISHGHLNPFSSSLAYPFWQDHGSFLLWPLAFLDWLWPHPVTLLWLQDAAAAGAEAVALIWICELASIKTQRGVDRRIVLACVSLALILMVVNPWITWTISSDFHTEPLAALWLVAAARDLFADRRRAWIWIALALLTGDVGASCCGALGLSAMITGRRWWRTGLAVALAGFGWMVLLGAIHATEGTVPSYFAPLILGHTGRVPVTTSAVTIAKAIVLHPARAITAIWANRLNVWADLSSMGVIGIAWRPVMLPMLLILAEGALTHGPQASLPGFQNFPFLVLGVVGTVAICLNLAERHSSRTRSLLPVLLVVLAINGLGWATTWLSQLQETWLPVSASAAATLRAVSARIGPDDQVLVQQGVSTDFARRRFIHLVFTPPTSVRINNRRVWLIFAPEQGSEPADAASIDAAMSRLALMPHMRLVASANGIWAFTWAPPAGTRDLTIRASNPPSVAAWTVAGEAGAIVDSGSAARWHVTSNGRAGYVVAGDYWREPTGHVSAHVKLAVNGSANVELWDDTAERLLDRRVLSHTNGSTTVDLSGSVRPARITGAYAGWGPWRIRPKQAPSGHVLEIRVWSPGAKTKLIVETISVGRDS